MTKGFLDHMRIMPDHRVPGVMTYPLDDILLTTPVGASIQNSEPSSSPLNDLGFRPGNRGRR